MTYRERLFKNRVKPIVIMLMILTIPIVLFAILSFSSYPANFFYEGIGQSFLSVFMFLMGIEQYI
ncbi:hypothetical protein ACFCYN_14190 [Gottfriedia sp. NPDC056225]|uniref:hypothetical protein n=1 Tax=Gottfriedia sp. NPDC056225 TaxID=3345751 RepID=UPI0035DDC7E5